ncbi:MAG: hypothetical protein IJA75_06575 [Oscillospiraceae bacterium]|nr:hypothetical protein [Oscillospiraceae bacterium]
MAGLTADQIIERIANANGADPAVMRMQMEQALSNILSDTTQPHSSMLADLFPGGIPTVDELVVALKYELYDAMMPKFPGWKWDGEGYRNMSTQGRNG